MVSSMFTHGWALSHHMFICGLNHDGSSKVPALEPPTSGVATTSPHDGRAALGAELAVDRQSTIAYVLESCQGSPSIRRLSFGRTTKIERQNWFSF